MNDLLIKILEIYEIDPGRICSNGQTALERLGGAVMGVMDEIEE